MLYLRWNDITHDTKGHGCFNASEVLFSEVLFIQTNRGVGFDHAGRCLKTTPTHVLQVSFDKQFASTISLFGDYVGRDSKEEGQQILFVRPRGSSAPVSHV